MRIKETLSRVSWTMVDQGMVSVGNFVLNVALARHLAQADYGVFALLFGAFMALQIVNGSLLSYPLSVRLPVAAPEDRPRLVATNFALVLAVCVPLVAILVAGLIYFNHANLVLPASLAFILWQSQESLRRGLLAEFRHKVAVIGDAVTYLGQAAVIMLLSYLDQLTLESAFYAMAFVYAIGALIQAWQLPLSPLKAARFKETIKDYWSIGSYSLANNLVSMFRIQTVPWTLAAVSGPAAAAGFQAALNVVNLANPIILGLANIIPQAAASARSGGNSEAWRSARLYALFGAPPAFAFYALVFAVPGLVLLVFYGANSPYLDLALVVRILIVAWIGGYVTDMICSFFHGVDSAHLAFAINSLGAVAAVILACPLISMWGLTGAAFVLIGANALRLIASYYLLTRTIADERPA